MDSTFSSAVAIPQPLWRENLGKVAEHLRNSTRWALVCPRPKKTSSAFLFFPSSSSDELPEDSSLPQIFLEDIFTVLVTIISAAVLLYLVDYFAQFCYCLGYVLSGKDVPQSALPTPSSSPPRATDMDSRATDRPPIVKMNEPKPSIARHTPPVVSLSSSSSEKRMAAGKVLEMETEELERFLDFNEEKEPVAYVFGGIEDDGEMEKTGRLSLEQRGPVEFVWLNGEKETSITGSFFGFNFSVPLKKEGDQAKATVTLPPGEYEYEFILQNSLTQ